MKISRPEMIHFTEFRNMIALLNKWGVCLVTSKPHPGDSRLQAGGRVGPEAFRHDIALDAESKKRMNLRYRTAYIRRHV
jgi:hypothetical protein